MSFTKEDFADIRNFYEAYFESYQQGDTEKLAVFLDDELTLSGGTNHEIFQYKKEPVEFLKSSETEVARGVEFRNRRVNITPVFPVAMVTELNDLYIRINGEWTFCGHVRNTVMVQKKSGQWKVVQQESSLPDTRTSGNEIFAFEKIREENLLLREAVERSVAELEHKNRELTIEKALERVRAKTMAMHNSEEVGETVCAMFDELVKLGVRTHRCGIAIFKADPLFEIWTARSEAGKKSTLVIGELDMSIHPMLTAVFQAWKEKSLQFVYELTGDSIRAYYEAINAYANYPTKFNLSDIPEKEILNEFYFKEGALFAFTTEHLSDDSVAVCRRFAAVFGQTYRRYLDLQKAESQAKDAQIEAALERVRSQSMAMHSSSDLQEVIRVVNEQLLTIGIKFDHVTFVKRHEDRSWDLWIATPGQRYSAHVHMPFFDTVIFREVDEIYAKGLEFFSNVYSQEEKNSFFTHFFNQPAAINIPEERKEYVLSRKGMARSAFLTKIIWFNIANYDAIPYTDEENAILKRFAHVFEQSYTRFLDLQKAEAQAKEAKIEVALERVRSRAMAMQNSEELNALIGRLFIELTGLDMVLTRCVLMITDPRTNDSRWWMANSEAPEQPANFLVQHHEYKPNLAYQKAWKERNQRWVYILEGNDKKEWDDFIFTHTELRLLPDFVIAGMRAPERVYLNASCYSFGNLTLASLEPLSDEHFDILIRFAKVFDLTYTRFSDLKQAEARARESQIEASLERVRSRAIAMHSSADLHMAVTTVFEELDKLNLGMLRCGIGILDKEKGTGEIFTTVRTEEGLRLQVTGDESMHIHPLLQGAFDAWKRNEDFNYRLEGTDLDAYYQAVSDGNFKLPGSQGMISENVGQSHDYFMASFDAGALYAFRDQPFGEEAKAVLKRFANVFNLTYKRFQDLLKAEAQAREAVIEASLEKVRGMAMAMHNSDDLSSTASMVFTELRKLGIRPIRCGVGLLHKETRKAQLYASTSSPAGDHLALIGWVELEGHPVLAKVYESWLNNEDFFPELEGEQLGTYYKQLLSGLSVPTSPEWETGETQYGHFFPFSVGMFYSWAHRKYTPAEIKIFKRFAAIIDLTFRRYTELKASEASAREAVRRASLDRVRAEIASMRTVTDLEKITPVIWNELTALGVPFSRCGVFIMDDEKELMHSFLSTPDGKALAAFHLPFDAPGNIPAIVDHWRNKKIFVDHWDEAAFNEWTSNLVKLGLIPKEDNYLSNLPQGLLHLYFLPFLQGMLYVGNLTELKESDLSLIQSVAESFSTAYARYEDFNRLELAKQQVDRALIELKQAQTQLIQSEKMASLGELTAGIAHEIQNPLNFVNNFSEIANELIAEMNEEISRGEYQLAAQIATDLRQNLEKINLHGKRADGIVKAMLQHSRTGSNVKEPTDLNALCDEYLRLSYHGLRAKDKVFNAQLETDFDESLGRVEVLAQDISRVLLNLFNNAFYAVMEKKKKAGPDYQPKVTVTTRKNNDNVVITVQDNGVGIPARIKEKIFQPFFTTKPTGQGTGLGLSLSYDIITQGHGGSFEFDSTLGEGSRFSIIIPI